MSVSLDHLKEQLKAAEQELEALKANTYQVAGAVQLLKNLIAKAEEVPATAENA